MYTLKEADTQLKIKMLEYYRKIRAGTDTHDDKESFCRIVEHYMTEINRELKLDT